MLPDFTFHHIGYAVRDIACTAEYYTNAGWTCSEIIVDPIQNVRIAFLQRENTPLIELVAPEDENSPVNQTLHKVGVSPYHICYEVPDMQDAISRLRRMRFLPLFKPVPAIALQNREICYLYNQNVGLIEILR